MSMAESPSTRAGWVLVMTATRSAGQPLDQVELPERAVAVQGLGGHPRDQRAQLLLGARAGAAPDRRTW